MLKLAMSTRTASQRFQRCSKLRPRQRNPRWLNLVEAQLTLNSRTFLKVQLNGKMRIKGDPQMILGRGGKAIIQNYRLPLELLPWLDWLRMAATVTVTIECQSVRLTWMCWERSLRSTVQLHCHPDCLLGRTSVNCSVVSSIRKCTVPIKTATLRI